VMMPAVLYVFYSNSLPMVILCISAMISY